MDYVRLLKPIGYLFTLFAMLAGAWVQAGSEPKGYGVQPGDILSVSVWKEDGLQQEVLVRPDGGISFPMVGDISAKGRTLSELADEISEQLGKYIADPVVTVSLIQNLGNRIYVIGKVNKPGEFMVNRYLDVIQALSMAGGMNPFANGKKIQILRREGEEQIAIPFSYQALEKGDLKQNIVLQPGDVVLVP